MSDPASCKHFANQRSVIERHGLVPDGRCDPRMRTSDACPTLAGTSQQRFEQAVNLPAYAYGGSNPSRPTRAPVTAAALCRVRRVTKTRNRARHSRRCITTTSSQRPNFRPTSRSVPTTSKPWARCRAIDASWPADDAGEHGVEAVRHGHRQQLAEHGSADTSALPVTTDVDGVLDRRAVGGPVPVRRQRPEADHLAPSTATTAAYAPARAEIQARWSSSDRGTRSNVAVDSSTSAL